MDLLQNNKYQYKNKKNIAALDKEMEEFELKIKKDEGYCYNDINAKHFELYYKLYIRYQKHLSLQI